MMLGPSFALPRGEAPSVAPLRPIGYAKQMEVFVRNGFTLSYDSLGPASGRPVLLIHGFATSRTEMWRRLGWYGAFERKGYRLIAPDLRGHGDSSKAYDPAKYASSLLLADLVGLLDHLNIARADVLGYSMGARLALMLAVSSASRVDHVVAAGVGGRLLGPAAAPGAMAAAMEASDPDSISEPMLRSFRLFADEQGADCKALAAFSRAPSEPLTREHLAQITAPCLIIAGARDALAGDPEELAAHIHGAKARQLPGCDHFSAISHGLLKASVFDFFSDELDL